MVIQPVMSRWFLKYLLSFLLLLLTLKVVLIPIGSHFGPISGDADTYFWIYEMILFFNYLISFQINAYFRIIMKGLYIKMRFCIKLLLCGQAIILTERHLVLVFYEGHNLSFLFFHTLLSEITVAIFRHERLCWQSNTNLSFGGIFSLVDYFYSRPMRILLADSSCCCCDNKEKHGLSILRNNKWYSRIFGLWVGGNTMTKCLTVILFPVLQKTFFSYRRKFMVHQVFWLVKCLSNH